MALIVSRSNDLVTLIVSGKITAEDLYDGVDSLYEGSTPEKVLWDFSDAELPGNPNAIEQLREFSLYATERGQARHGNKVAVIAPGDAQFGMSRMSAAFANLNQAAYDMRVFRDRESALAWLATPEAS